MNGITSFSLLLLLKLAQKFVGPWLITHLGKQLNKNNKERSKKKEQQNHREHEAVVTISDLLTLIEEKIDNQSMEIQNIHRSIQQNNGATTVRIPAHV